MAKKGRKKLVAEAAEAAPQEEPLAEDAAEARRLQQIELKWKKLKGLAYHCGLCCGVIRSFKSHCSRRPACKASKASRPLTEGELTTLRAEFDIQQSDPQRTYHLL